MKTPSFEFLLNIEKNGQKFSKNLSTRLQRLSGPNAFRIILVLMHPTYGQNISSKAVRQLVTFLRE
jgi:hypothetical protein